VFLALEEQESQEKPHPFVSEKLKNYQKSKEGRQAVALVREFLEFFQLDFTTAVFDPETNASESYPGRDQLARELGVDPSSDAPLVSSLLTRPQVHSSSHSPFSPSLHTHPHTLPHHAASFPTPLHHPIHHHITNGNSLLTPSSDSTHLRSHQHHIVTATGSISTQTSTVTTVTGAITTTTASGNDPPTSTTSLPRLQEMESTTLAGGGLRRATGTQGNAGSSSSQKELDDFFGTLTPISSLPPPPPMTHPSAVDSDASLSELGDSVESGKTTDVTQTEASFGGDFDYQTDIVSQGQ
jgi:FGFR1 oncogene partner